MRQEPERANPVIEADEDHLRPHPLRFYEVGAVVQAGTISCIKRVAVDPDHHRQSLTVLCVGVIGGNNIDVQAILAHRIVGESRIVEMKLSLRAIRG